MAGKIFKFLPKAASFSIPNNNKKKFFSCPVVSIVPDHCKRKSDEMVKEDEPTSPNVSCIGQVNHKKVNDDNNRKKKMKLLVAREKERREKKVAKRTSSVIHRMLCRRVRDDSDDEAVEAHIDTGKTRRYASRRDAFKDFDLRTVTQNVVDCKGEEVLVPHSAPILVGRGAMALEPKKEINIWERRASPPPIPLQLN